MTDNTFTVRDTYTSGEFGTTLERLTAFGGGHTWPGGVQYMPEQLIGLTSRDFNANDEIWHFCKTHAIPEPDAAVLLLMAGTFANALRPRPRSGVHRH